MFAFKNPKEDHFTIPPPFAWVRLPSGETQAVSPLCPATLVLFAEEGQVYSEAEKAFLVQMQEVQFLVLTVLWGIEDHTRKHRLTEASPDDPWLLDLIKATWAKLHPDPVDPEPLGPISRKVFCEIIREVRARGQDAVGFVFGFMVGRFPGDRLLTAGEPGHVVSYPLSERSPHEQQMIRELKEDGEAHWSVASEGTVSVTFGLRLGQVIYFFGLQLVLILPLRIRPSTAPSSELN
jgi:hypothetical protein